jgi:hypothetical protein
LGEIILRFWGVEKVFKQGVLVGLGLGNGGKMGFGFWGWNDGGIKF